jgi:NADPH:quinone reductase
VDVVFDPIGRPTFRDSLRAARSKGLIVSFGSVGGAIDDIKPIELGEAGSLFLTRPRLADHLTDAKTIRWRATTIFQALLEGSLSIAVSGRYGFHQVDEAHEALEKRCSIGKPILEIS